MAGLILKRSNVTARQVACRAGVSQTTVSFVLNDTRAGKISPATRERVQQAASDLGYVPRAAARSLVRGRSDTLGLVLFFPHEYIFADPYAPNLLAGISEVARLHNFRIMVEIINEAAEIELVNTMLRSGEVAGLLQYHGATRDEVHDCLSSLTGAGFPLVSLEETKTDDIYSVTIDHMAGARAVIEHLIDLGHGDIACITYAADEPHAQQRLNVFRQILSAAGIPLRENLIRHGRYEPVTAVAAMRSLLQERPRPTAVFGMNDMMAIGAMTAIREAGLRIPQDIAVAGYDDVRLSRFTAPPLTTARAPEVELGRAAATMLLELINDRTPPARQVKLHSRLIVRESCGAQGGSNGNGSRS